MIERKQTKTTKVQLKDLTFSDGKVLDSDGIVKDLYKVIAAAFNDNDIFDFTITSTTKDSELIEEE